MGAKALVWELAFGTGMVRRAWTRRSAHCPWWLAFCRRLDMPASSIGPARSVTSPSLTHGQVIEALVANRLTSPQPLLHVEAWAREWAVAEVFGIEPPTLQRRPDRPGPRRGGPGARPVVGSIGARAIDVFGIDVSRIHWDMTSISLFGAYDGHR